MTEKELSSIGRRIFWLDKLKGAMAISGMKEKDKEVYMYRFREAIKKDNEEGLAKIVDDVFKDYPFRSSRRIETVIKEERK